MSNMRSRLVLTLAFCSLTSLSSDAGLLSTGTHYNVFAFGDYTQQSVDVTGRLAVRGNTTLTNFGVGSALSTTGGTSLVVGGDLKFTNGQVNRGDIRVGGSASVANFGLPNGTLYYNSAGNPAPPSWIAQRQVAGGGIASDFFSSALTSATALSSTLGALATTGTVSINPQGKVALAGASAGLNVFNLTAAQFAGASGQGLDITAPTGGTVVVNIKGDGSTILTAGNFAFGLSGGVNRQGVVYNLIGISEFRAINLGIQGSLLAPTTNFKGTHGAVDGDVVVSTVTGSTEFHNVEFLGGLPTPTSVAVVPEPSTIACSLIGVAAFAIARRRKAG